MNILIEFCIFIYAVIYHCGEALIDKMESSPSPQYCEVSPESHAVTHSTNINDKLITPPSREDYVNCFRRDTDI